MGQEPQGPSEQLRRGLMDSLLSLLKWYVLVSLSIYSLFVHSPTQVANMKYVISDHLITSQ
jgi:hypothetical protein